MLIENIGNYLMRFTANPYLINRYRHDDGFCEYRTSCGIEAQPLSDDLSSFLLREVDGVIDRVDLYLSYSAPAGMRQPEA